MVAKQSTRIKSIKKKLNNKLKKTSSANLAAIACKYNQHLSQKAQSMQVVISLFFAKKKWGN